MWDISPKFIKIPQNIPRISLHDISIIYCKHFVPSPPSPCFRGADPEVAALQAVLGELWKPQSQPAGCGVRIEDVPPFPPPQRTDFEQF